MLHYFKILVYSCLATGRDTESLLVEVSPFSHVVLPTGRSFLATVLFLRSSLPVGYRIWTRFKKCVVCLQVLALVPTRLWDNRYKQSSLIICCIHICISSYVKFDKVFFPTIYSVFDWYFHYDKQRSITSRNHTLVLTTFDFLVLQRSVLSYMSKHTFKNSHTWLWPLFYSLSWLTACTVTFFYYKAVGG